MQLTCPDFQGPHLGLKPVQKSPTKPKAPMARTWPKPAVAYVPEPHPAPSMSFSSATSWRGGTATTTPSASAQIHTYEEASPEKDDDEDLPPPPAFDESKSPPVNRIGVRKGLGKMADAVETPEAAPPAFDESATRWAHEQEVDQDDDEEEEGLPPPPPYQERPPTTTTTSAVVPPSVRQPDTISSKFSDAVRVSEKAGTGGGASLSAHHHHASSIVSAPSTKSCSPPRLEAASGTSLSPTSVASVTPQIHESFSAPVQKVVRGGGYGLDAELAAKREANYDHDAEFEAQEWIENVTNEPFALDFEEELRDGRRLCILINAIKPGAVRKVNDSRMPFKQMENISNFLRACRSVGVAEHSLFETVRGKL